MKTPVRHLTTRLACIIACALACAPAGAQAAEALPDLVSDAPDDRGLQVDGNRLLLRFDGFIRNTGPGAVELRGVSPQNGILTGVVQRIYDEDGITISRDVPSPALIRWEDHAGHTHFHLQSAARYSLWSEDRLREVIGSEKAGFCLTDSFHAEPDKGPPLRVYATGCSEGNPNPSEVVMGISSGWRDDYYWNLAFQWVDVSSLRPGRYRLGGDVDPDNLVLETDESNPVAIQEEVSVIPGYVARARDLGEVNPLVPLEIQLGADRYERGGGPPLGLPSYEVTRPPTCGRVSGEPPLVIYRPGKACKGAVSFQFAARDSASAFPSQAPSATVRFRLGTRRALSKPRARQRGRRLRVRVRSQYAGRVRVTALVGGRRLGSCSSRVRARRPVSCAIHLGRAPSLKGVRLRTALSIGGRVVDQRRDPVG